VSDKRELRNVVDGLAVHATDGRSSDLVNPTTGEVFATAPVSSADDVDRAYQAARAHKWYMSARLVTMNDLYAFEPGVVVDIEDFTDIIGRNFRQPKEGLGWDNSPSAHMWRTIMWPTRFL
jgi:acyl-CoA reductase-like NAD-dependent aldehyde dehydrogenase